MKGLAGGVKAGGNLLGAMAAGLGMLTGGYKGAIASSAGGIIQQAVGMSTGRTSSGISIKATISLGGGGGGATSLIAKGLTSGIGIGIPRFGGIPAVRGAGFQVRSVGYKRPSSGGRGSNHAPEGRSDAGERD